jgi:hypothetical protein
LLSAGVQLSFQDEVREQQVEAAESNTGVALITTLDLPISPDGVHFTVNSYKEIGMRFAHAWWQLDYALAASLVRCGDVSRMVSPNPSQTGGGGDHLLPLPAFAIDRCGVEHLAWPDRRTDRAVRRLSFPPVAVPAFSDEAKASTCAAEL